jgi:hypothetical protein
MSMRIASLPLILSAAAAAACGDPVSPPTDTDGTGSSTGTDSLVIDGTATSTPESTTTDAATGSTDPTTTAADTSSGSASGTEGATETTSSACGDGIADPGEACDGEDLGGATCESEGFDRGALACTAICQLDTSGCEGCGDEVLGPGEECDSFELGGETCESQGFDAGILGCTGRCTFDTSICYLCGNGVLEPGEACEGANLDGQTCVGLGQGYTGGALACTNACTLDPTGCTPTYTIDFCRLQFPLDVVATTGTDLVVYGRLYIAGLTDQSPFNEPAAAVDAWVGYGPDGSDPAVDPGWTWIPATPNPGWNGDDFGEPNNDEYQATMVVPAPGTYDLAYRFSGDSGGTFTVCDGDPGGSTTGYSPADAGALASVP